MSEGDYEEFDSEAFDISEEVEIEDSEIGAETESERESESRRAMTRESESESESESEDDMSEANSEEGGIDDDSETGMETGSESQAELELAKAGEEEGGDQRTYLGWDGYKHGRPLDGKCEVGAHPRQAMLAGALYGSEGDDVTGTERGFLMPRPGANALLSERVDADDFIRCFWEGRGQNWLERRRWRVKRRQQCRLMRQCLKIEARNEKQKTGKETQKAGRS